MVAMTNAIAIMPATDRLPSMDAFPDELLLHIMSYLDVPELLNASRTNHHWRKLSRDPVLHSARRSRASLSLNRSLSARPPLTDLIYRRIYITRTTLAARVLGKNLIKIKLNRALIQRPSPSYLVELGVLPAECICNRRGDFLAPSLIETKRRIEREKLKDTMRSWVEDWRRRGVEGCQRELDERRPDVRAMVRRFARVGVAGSAAPSSSASITEQRWGRTSAKSRREEPTRAKVLGLRRYWEKVAKTGSA